MESKEPPNDELPVQLLESIACESKEVTEERAGGRATPYQYGYTDGYYTGATSYAIWLIKYNELKERCDKIEMALKEILKQHDYYSVIELAAEALKEGESNTLAPVQGKEVNNGIEITTGLKFRNIHMPDYSFTVVKATPNFLDVTIAHDKEENHRWTENDWIMEHTQWAFKKGEYFLPKQ